jgi:hypothetical protein
MTYFTSGVAIVLILGTTACASLNSSGDPSAGEKHASRLPPMEPSRTISERDCRYAFNFFEGNIRCN